jgi:hypothetical protein
MLARHTVQRLTDMDGKTLSFMVYLGSRRRGWRTFRPEAVPPFEGETAVFEVDIRQGVWTFVRQIAPVGPVA